jgi:hypothetical protein
MVLRKMSIALGVALAITAVGSTPSFFASSGSKKSLFQKEHVFSVNFLKNASTMKVAGCYFIPYRPFMICP